MNVLFICSGNVARSQEAAAYLKKLRRDLTVISAGTEAIVGKPINPDVVAAMKEDGIVTKDWSRKKLTHAMLHEADYIVSFVKDAKMLRNVEIDEFWDVPDPRGGTLEDHRLVRDNIARRVAQLGIVLV